MFRSVYVKRVLVYFINIFKLTLKYIAAFLDNDYPINYVLLLLSKPFCYIFSKAKHRSYGAWLEEMKHTESYILLKTRLKS